MKYLDALATFWQRNAEIRHGHLPRTGDVQVPSQAVPGGDSLMSKLAPYVAAAAIGGGATMATPFVLDLFKDDPPVQQQAVPQDRDGSLFQYLEDRGDHLPL